MKSSKNSYIINGSNNSKSHICMHLVQRKADFQISHINHTLRFTCTTYTSTKNINFMWKDFLGFYVLIYFIEPLETYVFLLYPNITNCLYSWVVFRKEKGISPLVPKLMPPTCGTRKNGPVINLNVPCKQWNNMLD